MITEADLSEPIDSSLYWSRQSERETALFIRHRIRGFSEDFHGWFCLFSLLPIFDLLLLQRSQSRRNWRRNASQVCWIKYTPEVVAGEHSERKQTDWESTGREWRRKNAMTMIPPLTNPSRCFLLPISSADLFPGHGAHSTETSTRNRNPLQSWKRRVFRNF